MLSSYLITLDLENICPQFIHSLPYLHPFIAPSSSADSNPYILNIKSKITFSLSKVFIHENVLLHALLHVRTLKVSIFCLTLEAFSQSKIWQSLLKQTNFPGAVKLLIKVQGYILQLKLKNGHSSCLWLLTVIKYTFLSN